MMQPWSTTLAPVRQNTGIESYTIRLLKTVPLQTGMVLMLREENTDESNLLN